MYRKPHWRIRGMKLALCCEDRFHIRFVTLSLHKNGFKYSQTFIHHFRHKPVSYAFMANQHYDQLPVGLSASVSHT